MDFFDFLTQNMFMFDMVIIAAAFCVRFSRRKLFWVRLPVSLVVSVAAANLLPEWISIGGSAGNLVWYAFEFALVVAMMAVCLKLKLWKIFFTGSTCYFIQNGAFCLDRVLRGAVPINVGNYLLHYLFIAIFVAAVWLIYWRKVTAESLDYVRWLDAVILMAAAVVVCLVISSFSDHITGANGVRVFYAALLACVLISLCCQYAVFRISLLMRDKLKLEELLDHSAKQYFISKENIGNLNIKCHDLKYKIAEFEAKGFLDGASLNEMKTIIQQYDCTVQSGNSELDIVLTEKSLACRNKDIEFTCMADGAQLPKMDPGDLYAFFGNALDNAIEATEKLEGDRRYIGLTVRRIGDIVAVNICNYTNGRVKIENGLPQTTKDDKFNHGFGVRSIEFLARKYSGEVSFVQEEDVFNLNAVFPCRQTEKIADLPAAAGAAV